MEANNQAKPLPGVYHVYIDPENYTTLEQTTRTYRLGNFLVKKLLVDADFIVYKCCAAAEDEIDWGDDVIVVISKFSAHYKVLNVS